MLLYHPDHLNTAIHLAAEEYLLKKLTHDIIMLWRGKEAIVIGKHQNPLAEIDHQILFTGEIPVFRRISGGGTVYHDPGNLNISYLSNSSHINFEPLLSLITEFLSVLGLQADINARNNICIRGKKISGTAAHIHRKRAVHHASLLVEADLQKMHAFLKQSYAMYSGSSLPSQPAQVANIRSFLPILHMKTVVEEFKKFLRNKFADIQWLNATSHDLAAIHELTADKYSTNKWNLFYTPPYHLERKVKFRKGIVNLYIDVRRGKIQKLELDPPVDSEWAQLKECLSGVHHHPSYLRAALTGNCRFHGAEIDEFIKQII